MGRRQVCELTPGGRGAVCVLQLRADNVAEIVQVCFCAAGKRPLAEYPLRQPVYGYWRGIAEPVSGPGDQADSQSSEDVVTCRLSDDELEVHCHGGEFAKRRIIESLKKLDFEVVAWRDWNESNGKSPIVIAASRLLPLTHTIKTASIVNWQVSGALDRALDELLLSLPANRIDKSLKTLDKLLAWEFLVPHLIEPWQVAIVGPPNVGKSSLMNRLVGFERSIVFDQPGTTRDLVSALTAINGWPVKLIDTAGLRETGHNIESMGIDLARQALRAADLVISVQDVTSPDLTISAADRSAIGSKPVISVLNKSDLLNESPTVVDDESMFVSAATGDGIDRLIDEIALQIVPTEPEFNQAVPFLDEHLAILRQARTAMASADIESAIQSIESLLIDSQIVD